MSDKPQWQVLIEDSMPDTSKPQLFKEVEDLGKNTIGRVLPQIEKCMQDLKCGQEGALYLHKVADTLDTLQKCCQYLEVLVRIETHAVGLRKLLEEKIEKKSQKNS